MGDMVEWNISWRETYRVELEECVPLTLSR